MAVLNSASQRWLPNIQNHIYYILNNNKSNQPPTWTCYRLNTGDRNQVKFWSQWSGIGASRWQRRSACCCFPEWVQLSDPLTHRCWAAAWWVEKEWKGSCVRNRQHTHTHTHTHTRNSLSLSRFFHIRYSWMRLIKLIHFSMSTVFQ